MKLNLTKLKETKDTDSDPKFQMTKELQTKRFLMARSRRERIGGVIQSDHNKEDGDVRVIYKKEGVMRKKLKSTETVAGKIVQAIMNWDQALEELIDNRLISDSDPMELTIPNMILYLRSKFPNLKNIGPRFSEVSCALEGLEILTKVKRGRFHICSIDSNKIGQLNFDQLYEIVIGRVNSIRDARIKKQLEDVMEDVTGKRKDKKKVVPKKVVPKKVVKSMVLKKKVVKKKTTMKSSNRTVKILEGPVRVTGININFTVDGISLEIRFKE